MRVFLELEGNPVVDVVADVFLVGQDFLHGRSSPWPIEIGAHFMPLSRPAMADSESDLG
jgi:hypothetical protein